MRLKSAAPESAKRPGAGGKTPNLDQYTVNLTRTPPGQSGSRAGARFRDPPGDRYSHRRRQNIPFWSAKPVSADRRGGGFALRIAQGDVPRC